MQQLELIATYLDASTGPDADPDVAEFVRVHIHCSRVVVPVY